MHPGIRDEIARCRAEARNHREQAGRLRRSARSAPCPMKRLTLRFAADERTRLARAADQEAEKWREQVPAKEKA